MKPLAFFFTLMVLPASARLGETVAECDARYGTGKAFNDSGDTRIYSKAGFDIICSFREGKVAIMGVSHSEKDVLGHGEEISAAEKEVLLKANGGGSEWETTTMLGIMKESWKTKDGLRLASYDKIERRLQFMTMAELQRRIKESEAADKAKLEGF